MAEVKKLMTKYQGLQAQISKLEKELQVLQSGKGVTAGKTIPPPTAVKPPATKPQPKSIAPKAVPVKAPERKEKRVKLEVRFTQRLSSISIAGISTALKRKPFNKASVSVTTQTGKIIAYFTVASPLPRIVSISAQEVAQILFASAAVDKNPDQGYIDYLVPSKITTALKVIPAPVSAHAILSHFFKTFGEVVTDVAINEAGANIAEITLTNAE